MGLSVESLRVSLGKRTVIGDVSVRLAPGRVTAVLGANGAGKSTLLRALAGLIAAEAGRVMLDGNDLAGIAPRVRAQAIGYLPQDTVVHWNMRVRDVVALGRLPHGGGGAEAIDAALAATDTAGFADRAIRTLSGGERARVLLARVLAGEPRWLLADEPLASLDPRHQVQTATMLRAAAAGGMGVVVVLHDLGLAARIADDAIVLRDGAVLASGPAATVLTETTLAAAYGVRMAILGHDGERAIVPVGPA